MIIKDLTQLKKETLSSIVNNQKSIIIITNGENIIQVNNSFLKFFNYKSLQDFLDIYTCVCERFIEDEGYLHKQNGDKGWLQTLIYSPEDLHKIKMLDDAGQVHIFQANATKLEQDNNIEYIVTLYDITALEDTTKNLEKLIYEKTKELYQANQDLKDTNQKLEVATLEAANKSMRVQYLNLHLQKEITKAIEENREKDQQMIQQSRLAQMGEMISMIAHQWRQPLAAISSTSSGLALKVSLNKASKEMIIELANKISQYSQHLSSTIDDFREFFKVNKEKKETKYLELIDSVLNIVEISLTNKNIKIIKNLDSNAVFYTYPNEIKQVILNIIKNAEDILVENNIKNPQITITTKDNSLKISDNGGGIPIEIMDKIFDPYFSTKLQKDGTGLGLYMSKTIIEEHCKGSLSVSNDENGAVFEIKLEGVNYV